jgi:hypothetical protein
MPAAERPASLFQLAFQSRASLTVSAEEEPKNLELFANPPFLIAYMLSTPSWRLTQLGVDGQNAIYNGGLSGKSLFFGSNNAEVIAIAAGNNTSSWNGDHALSLSSTTSWSSGGGRVALGVTDSGIFALAGQNGDIIAVISHRTILSGY